MVFTICGGFKWFSLLLVVSSDSLWFWVVLSVCSGFGWFSVLVVVFGGFQCSWWFSEFVVG